MKITKCKGNKNPKGIPRFAAIYFFLWGTFLIILKKINGIIKSLCFYL